MKKIELAIANCKDCPHFSRTTGVQQVPSCCYGKSYQLAKILPSHLIGSDDITAQFVYEVDKSIPNWCPLPEAYIP